jgi:leishmanolysin
MPVSRTTATAALLLLLLLGTLAATATAHTHECIHDQIKDQPGVGPNAETIRVNYYDPAAAHHHGAKPDSPLPPGQGGDEDIAVHSVVEEAADENSRTFRAQATAAYGASFKAIRIKIFFDSGDCSASGDYSSCGHCDSIGQSVATFSSNRMQTCRSQDVLSSEKKSYMMDTLMPNAIAFYTKALNVNRTVGSLVVSGSGMCGSAPGTPVPSSHQSDGVSNVDFIVYVTAAPLFDSTAATVAWAVACRNDQDGRPLVAHVNFVPATLTNAATSTRSTVLQANDEATAVHEIAHALGFASPFFGSRGYVDTSGNRVATGGTTSIVSSALGKTVKYITSPRVVRESQAYFGCTTLVGAEIEDQGGAGTAGSHFEKRIFMEDSMSGISTSIESYHSKMLLAFFEDTGHYTANYAYADSRLTWGKNKGCDFTDTKCSGSNNRVNREWCWDETPKKSFCTHDYLGGGHCNIASYTADLASSFQHFVDTKKGGSLVHDDFCPIVLPFANKVCIDDTVADSQDIYGNTYGTGSRCFVSDTADAGFTLSTSVQQTRCFPVTCSVSGSLQLDVKGWVASCPIDGTAGAADVSQLDGKFSGSIMCPAASELNCFIGGAGGPTAVPTPRPTTNLSGQGEYATMAPPALPSTCALRIACAKSIRHTYPQCRKLADALLECFGTDCDGTMELYLDQLGVKQKCADKPQFRTECQEGAVGVAQLCQLAIGAAGGPSALAAAVGSVLVAVVMTVM